MMTPKEIIAEAWAITLREKKIRAWGFASELLSTLLETKLLIYQSYFAYVYFWKGGTIGFFVIEELLLKILPLWGFVTFIIILCTLLILEVFIPKMCLGAIIGLAAKAHKKEEIKGGLVLAIYNFLPLFAVRELFVLAHITTIITIASLIIRYMPNGIQAPIIVLLLTFYFFSNVFRFFAIFAEEDMVIRKQGMFSALGRSFKLIISHVGHIFFVLLLLLVIGLRVLLNAVVLLIIPAIILGISILLASFLSGGLTFLFSSIAGVILILFASYFFAYLHVFTQTVWTITYMELQKMKDLDVIGVEMEPEKALTVDNGSPTLDAPSPPPS